MPLSRVNFFVPYEGAAAHHENQLTRALLVALRYSPLAHQAWLRLIDADLNLSDLPEAQFATQRQKVFPQGLEVATDESVTGISVWLAPGSTTELASMSPSDRLQILDGIVTYGTELVVVVENKIRAGASTEQPHRINLHGAPVVFCQLPKSVAWERLLGVFADLVERNLVFGAERLLLEDFLELVEGHFPHIGPYSTLHRCGNHRSRLERRLDAVQEEAVGAKPGKGIGWRDISGTDKIFMAWLGLSDDGSTVSLRMYPADTLGQSRAFYSNSSEVKTILGLRSDGWRIEPNFHWGFSAGGYCWSASPMMVDEYCDYWLLNISVARELARSEWDTHWAKLVSDRVVHPDAKEQFDAEFTRSKRQKAHPRPGLFCEYLWPLAEARRRDSHGQFSGDVRLRINQLLAALQAPSVPAEDAANQS